ncbi:hypothetical protein [Kitasatospora sp. NPDC088134]|uniref:hypothetical protein n=1 Tax=Kitasatospora sp. NPDC088134 TaxID=3364071 RepID=UPI003804C1BA
MTVSQYVLLTGTAVVVGEYRPLDGADGLWRRLPPLNSPLTAAAPGGFVLYGEALMAPAGLEGMEARGMRTMDVKWAFGVAEQPW